MTADQLKALFRQEMADTAEPYLWSDVEVYAYLDDAQKMFCRLTDGISDATTAAVVEIEVSAGDTWLDLHPAIKKIRAASRESDGAPLTLLNYEDLAPRGLRFDGSVNVVSTVITGMEENKLRLAAVASLDDVIKLLVFRLPLTTLSASEQTLEIGEEHHIHLLPWAKSRALLKQDGEVFDREKSEELETIFRGYCARALQEQGLKRHKGVRSVRYGGL